MGRPRFALMVYSGDGYAVWDTTSGTFDKAEAERKRDALNAAHERGELDPRPEPVREERRKEDFGRFYVDDAVGVTDRRAHRTLSYPLSIDNKSDVDVAKFIASALSAAFDRRKTKWEPVVDERKGERRGMSRRQHSFRSDHSYGRRKYNLDRRHHAYNRRQRTGTRADRAKGGE